MASETVPAETALILSAQDFIHLNLLVETAQGVVDAPDKVDALLRAIHEFLLKRERIEEAA